MRVHTFFAYDPTLICITSGDSSQGGHQLSSASLSFVVNAVCNYPCKLQSVRVPLLRYITIVTVALLAAIFDPYNAAFVETGGM
eukprot:scaffold153939_cov23-Tisochrysis_lutea.AAC.1